MIDESEIKQLQNDLIFISSFEEWKKPSFEMRTSDTSSLTFYSMYASFMKNHYYTETKSTLYHTLNKIIERVFVLVTEMPINEYYRIILIQESKRALVGLKHLYITYPYIGFQTLIEKCNQIINLNNNPP